MMIVTVATIMLILGLAMLAALIGVVAYRRLRAGGLKTSGPPGVATPDSDPGRSGERGERQASAAAEVLESIIQRRMAADPALAGQRLDFGTSPDGSLEIWWNDQTYTGIDQLPDARVREVIAQAIEEFNRDPATPG
jgi:hypothetical protein